MQDRPNRANDKGVAAESGFTRTTGPDHR